MAGFADLAEYLIGHRSLSQTYFRVPPREIARIYREKLMPLLTFCDTPSLMKKVETLEEKTEIINDLQMQMRKQAEQIEKLQVEKDQTFADYANDNYGSEQFIEMLKRKIDSSQMQMNNQKNVLADGLKNTRSLADNIITKSRYSRENHICIRKEDRPVDEKTR